MEKKKALCPICKSKNYGILNKSYPYKYELKAYLKNSEALDK